MDLWKPTLGNAESVFDCQFFGVEVPARNPYTDTFVREARYGISHLRLLCFGVIPKKDTPL
jgi:hypothetical protein